VEIDCRRSNSTNTVDYATNTASLVNISLLKSNLINDPDKNQLKKSFSERPGDWTCFKCKNLNFSFRKRCNRCPTLKKESEELAAGLITVEESPFDSEMFHNSDFDFDDNCHLYIPNTYCPTIDQFYHNTCSDFHSQSNSNYLEYNFQNLQTPTTLKLDSSNDNVSKDLNIGYIDSHQNSNFNSNASININKKTSTASVKSNIYQSYSLKKSNNLINNISSSNTASGSNININTGCIIKNSIAPIKKTNKYNHGSISSLSSLNQILKEQLQNKEINKEQQQQQEKKQEQEKEKKKLNVNSKPWKSKKVKES
jgi:hypothetical protein